jgi:hypothetical protein
MWTHRQARGDVVLVGLKNPPLTKGVLHEEAVLSLGSCVSRLRGAGTRTKCRRKRRASHDLRQQYLGYCTIGPRSPSKVTTPRSSRSAHGTWRPPLPREHSRATTPPPSARLCSSPTTDTAEVTANRRGSMRPTIGAGPRRPIPRDAQYDVATGLSGE